MSDEGKKKGKGRVVITNVRVTKETHLRLKTLSELWGMTMSEAMDALIKKQAPEVDEIIREREEQIKRFSKRKPNNSDAN